MDIGTDVKSTRMGDVVVEFDNAVLKFSPEKVILDGFTYAFSKKEKIGIVGPNGAGKTTFIKTLLGEIPLDDGFVNVGETIRFGYYSQTAVFADDEQRVFERSAVVQVAIDARYQDRPDEPRFNYKPFSDLQDDFRFNDETFERVIKNYHTKDLAI